MISKNKKFNKFVTPGDRLGVIEEFLPGSGTYVDDGNIYSLTTGQIVIDMQKREVSVRPSVHIPVILKTGDIIIGQMASVAERNGTVRIFQKYEEPIYNISGVMHVSDVSKDYVKTMSDAFKIGDIVRAKIISTANREFHLSTQDDDLGVIQALCQHCGHQIVKQNNQLQCSYCKRPAQRKFTINYEKA